MLTLRLHTSSSPNLSVSYSWVLPTSNHLTCLLRALITHFLGEAYRWESLQIMSKKGAELGDWEHIPGDLKYSGNQKRSPGFLRNRGPEKYCCISGTQHPPWDPEGTQQILVVIQSHIHLFTGKWCISLQTDGAQFYSRGNCQGSRRENPLSWDTFCAPCMMPSICSTLSPSSPHKNTKR